jgi:hypothetical protein
MDYAIDFAEFSRINEIFYFHNRIGVEDIAQQVEHTCVRKPLVVVAQRETKPAFHPLDTDDNFHVNEIISRAEAAAQLMNTEESKFPGSSPKFQSHLLISFHK